LFYLAVPEISDAADGTQDTLLVRVVAEDGLDGWGESDSSPLVSLAAYVCPPSHGNIVGLRQSLVGVEVASVDDLRGVVGRARRRARDIAQVNHALAAADIALWDLLGKRLQKPVWQLLGHPESLPKVAYASVLFGVTPEDTESVARRIAGAGFRAAKFGWGPFGQGEVDDDVAQVHAARKGLGQGPRLMVDAGWAFGEDVERAEATARAIAPFGITWLEEPFAPEAIGAYAALALRATGVPLAAGESADDVRRAEDFLLNAGVDYLQVDAGRIGGITGAHAGWQLCRDLRRSYVNHTYKSHLSLAAALHVFAGDSHSGLAEFPFEGSALSMGLTSNRLPVDADGRVRAPSTVGLGVAVHPEVLAAYARSVRIEIDGSVLFRSAAPG
jgi:L-alanine-DL-glutamate epimerase-like enolase superfamily enzyme